MFKGINWRKFSLLIVLGWQIDMYSKQIHGQKYSKVCQKGKSILMIRYKTPFVSYIYSFTFISQE